MRAAVGDWLIVERARLGEPPREGQIVEVQHADGSPPYLVRWVDTERTSLVYPGSAPVWPSSRCTMPRSSAGSGPAAAAARAAKARPARS
ncbi:MAG: DUF1918 domain-containing protein [Carbonactinosporaceae bacterium]